MDTNLTRKLADSALEDYDFGSGVTVEAINRWEYDSRMSEVSCAVFLKFEEDSVDDDTHLATFYVDFKDDKVDSAYCHCDGETIGFMPVLA
jgi:hypothetical protein